MVGFGSFSNPSSNKAYKTLETSVSIFVDKKQNVANQSFLIFQKYNASVKGGFSYHLILEIMSTCLTLYLKKDVILLFNIIH
jgi:hypothetical protein